MRITFQSQYRDSSAAMEKAAEQLLEMQRRVSTGKRLDRISDDPTAAAMAVAERSNMSEVDRYTRAADGVASRLAVVDGVLSDVVSKLTAAQTVATAARGTSVTAAQRDALAVDLRGIRDTLLDNMNTSFHGNYLFAGSAVTTRPYAVPGGGTFATYAGNNSAVQVGVGNGRAVSVAMDGNAITRGSDSQDLFETLDELITAVSAGTTADIESGLSALQRAFERAVAAQTRIGSDLQAIDAQKSRLQELKVASVERLSSLEDLNMAEAITDMTHADAAYRASLGAVSTVSRVSLLDYMT